MTDRMRWRYDDTKIVKAHVDSETVIEIGDLVFQEGGMTRPASYCVDMFSFTKNFLGVSMQRSRFGTEDTIRVATAGVFEFDCPKGTFEIGDLVGVHLNNGWQNQMVAKVFDPKPAIGRVASRVTKASASVLVAIQSAIMGPIIR
ncbi:MAG: hypothetical protein WC942_04885 [Clostridia bacterium]